MSSATLSSTYQVALPKSIRDALSLRPGQEFELIPVGNVIQMIPKTSIQSLRGLARGADVSAYRDREE